MLLRNKTKIIKKEDLKKEMRKESKVNSLKNHIKPMRDKIKEKQEVKKVESAKRQLCLIFKETWLESMCHLKLYNELDETYSFSNLKRETYGFSCNIHNYKGGTLTRLTEDEWIKKVEQNMKAIFVPVYDNKKHVIRAIFITENPPYQDYTPVKLKPYQLLFGLGIDMKLAMADMVKFPHVLVQGATNMGKTKAIDTALVNLINTETPDDVELYIVQLDKSDQVVYRNTKHCKAWLQCASEQYDSLDEMGRVLGLLKHLYHEAYERENKILLPLKEEGICENIKEYNEAIEKGKIKGKKWSYRYLIIDEYASLMPNGNKTEMDKIKSSIQDIMERLIQISRSSGLFMILSTQRATIDKIPSFIKGMSNTKTVFRVANRKSSEVALDNDKAVYLEPREFIMVSDSGRMVYGKTMNLNTEMICSYLKPFKIIKDKHYDIDYLQFANLKSIIDNKKGNQRTNNSRKSKEERRAEAKEKFKENQKIKKSEESIGNICSQDLLKQIENLLNKDKKHDIKRLDNEKPQEITKNEQKVEENSEKTPKKEVKMLEKPKKEAIQSNLERKTNKNSPFLMSPEEFAKFANVKVVKDETTQNGMKASNLDDLTKREEKGE